MGLFSSKKETIYQVESETPKDENNTTTYYTADKQTAKEKKQELSQRENNVKIKKVR